MKSTAELEAEIQQLRRVALDLERDNDRLTKAERALEEIGRTTGCNHTGDPDGQMQLVNCVQDVIGKAEAEIAGLRAELERYRAVEAAMREAVVNRKFVNIGSPFTPFLAMLAPKETP